MNESLAFARNIVETNYQDLPSNVIGVTKKSFLDALGVTLAASTLGEGCKAFVDMAIAEGGKKESTILGFGAQTSAAMAAFANGAMAHALDFEDAHDDALMHPHAATIPAALAIAEALGNVSGKELLTAIALGSDLVCRLGLALNDNPLEYGWYVPPMFGAFGACAATAKLLRLNSAQIIDAFSLTLGQATFSADITSSPRSVVRSVRDAFAAKAGVISAQLAQRGVTGFDEPFEGRSGLFQLFARGNYNRDALTNGLGKMFEGGNVSFKPWPSCRGTHGYIDAALQILRERKLQTDDIEEINVVVSPVNKMLCDPRERKRNPGTAIDAKFSIPFTIATALRFGEVRLEHFSVRALADADTLKLARRVSYEVDTQLSLKQAAQGSLRINTKSHLTNNGLGSQAQPNDGVGAVSALSETDTGTIEKELGIVFGNPKNPISSGALAAKFKDCARYAVKKIPEERLKEIIEMVLNLEHVGNVCKLTETIAKA